MQKALQSSPSPLREREREEKSKTEVRQEFSRKKKKAGSKESRATAMNKRQAFLVKILVFLVVFNTFCLYVYFTTQSRALPSKPDRHHALTGNRLPLTENTLQSHRYLKPWPILPSYLPWSNTTAPLRSCEAYFGNGFTVRADLLKPTIRAVRYGGKVGGWFRCLYSETLRSSICEGSRVRMWPEKISMSRGGEVLEEVIGRKEEEELPEFQDGAFEVDGGDRITGEKPLATQTFLDQYLPRGEIQRHTMRSLFGAARIVKEKNFECDEVKLLNCIFTLIDPEF